MPELPEVETYVRELAPILRGRRVTGAQVLWFRAIAAPSAQEFVRQIVGERFAVFGRRGKYMLLGFDSGTTLIVHLRMTGRLLAETTPSPAGKHTHVVLDLDDGSRLLYQDLRKFGRLWLVPDAEPVLRNLGPEPFGEDFTVEGFAAKVAGRMATIKALLLDQSLVAGVGNIYADEALFRARLHPTRAGGSLSIIELTDLHQSIRDVLVDGISRFGSSLGRSELQNYMRPGGGQGGFQEEHRVFRRTGKPCLLCGTPIERIVIAQRSTHFCPNCQK